MRRSLAILVLGAVIGSAQADPPPFGTELERWRLVMSGAYAASGMTWRRDEGRFYLMDQGYAGPIRVWNLDPADPPGARTQ